MKRGVVALVMLGLGLLLFYAGYWLCGGPLLWAVWNGSDEQAKFYEAVGTGDVDQVLAIMSPSIQASYDPPMLAAMVEAINVKLGRFQKMDIVEASASTSYANGQKLTKSSGVVVFEHGIAESELVFCDDLLIGFGFYSEPITRSLLVRSADLTFYQQQGEAFLESLLSNQDDVAYGMMGWSLRSAMPQDQLVAKMAELSSQVGPLQSIELKEQRLSLARIPTLRCTYEVVCKKRTMPATIHFAFSYIKGELAGCDLLGIVEEDDGD